MELIEFWVKTTNQIIQDGFFIVGIVITGSQNINAKRTILQPMKTEIFKLQVTVFCIHPRLVDKQGYVKIINSSKSFSKE